MMSTIKILVSESLGNEGLAILQSQHNFQVELALGLSQAELCQKIPDYEALLVRSQTQVNAQLIEAGSKLRLIGRAGVGTDNIDLNRAQAHNITVINTPTGNSISTAELAFGLMIAMARKIPQAHHHVRSGQWQRSIFKGTELSGKTLGIIGFGNVGRLLAQRARAFDMPVVVHDPIINQASAKELGVEKLELNSLLACSDFISLNCGLNQDTKHIINQNTLKLTKKSLFLVNTARGELIEPKALLAGLDNGQLAMAALDVFQVEPPDPNDRLLSHPNIICTPHLGASTEEAQRRVSTLLAEQTIVFFQGPYGSKINHL